jgi:predicted transcriptional regulator of viral defense system
VTLATQPTQRERLTELLAERPIVRASELRREGIDAKTLSRAVDEGIVERIGRGLYQQPDSPIDSGHALAETAKKTRRGIIAMTSALAFHGLTDQMPRRIWVAIGKEDWAPVASYPPLRIVRFEDKYLRQGIEHHMISGVSVPIYSVAKTLADLFRNPRLIDRSVAIEGLRAALDQRKARPAEIAEAARAGGAWKIMRPYLEALTSNG